jgi:hypothetical protein
MTLPASLPNQPHAQSASAAQQRAPASWAHPHVHGCLESKQHVNSCKQHCPCEWQWFHAPNEWRRFT